MIRRSLIGIITNVLTALIGTLAIPILTQKFGAQEYAIIGIFFTIQSIVLVLEGGVSIELIRIVAKNGINPDLSRPNYFYRQLTVIIGLITAIISIYILLKWELPRDRAILLTNLISISIVLRIFSGKFRAQLYGLNEHSKVFLLNIPMYLLRFVLPIFIASNIGQFFIINLIGSSLEIIVLISILRKVSTYEPLETKNKPNFQLRTKNSLPIEFIISLASFSGLLLMNFDKVALSVILKQNQFGQYQSLSTLASGIFLLLGPINSIFQPKLMSLISNNQKYKDLFSSYTEIVLFITCVVQVGLITFSNELVSLWLGNEYSISSKLFDASIIYITALTPFSIGFMHSIIKKSLKNYLINVCGLILIVSILWIGPLRWLEIQMGLTISAIVIFLTGLRYIYRNDTRNFLNIRHFYLFILSIIVVLISTQMRFSALQLRLIIFGALILLSTPFIKQSILKISKA